MTGSTDHFLFILKRRKRIAINVASAWPPRTQPTMIPNLLLDNELWAAVDPAVAPVILLVDEGPEVNEVVLSGSSALG